MIITFRFKNKILLIVTLVVFILSIMIPSFSSQQQSVMLHESKFLTDQTFVVMQTSKGSMKLALYDDITAITVQNFLNLIAVDYYDGLVIHRVIDDFVIQGGGFDENGINKISPFDPIDLEIHPDARHIDGAIGMARASDPNSATSQFYICDGAQHFLDENYAVFGVVVEGMDVVRDIASVETERKHGMDDWPFEEIIIEDVSIVTQKIWYVDDDNSEGPWDGTTVYPFQHIQDAINYAGENDNVFIFDGRYEEQIHITTPVNLFGQSRQQTIISSQEFSETIIIDTANTTRIEHFTLLSEDGSLKSIHLFNSHHCTIQNIDITSDTPLHTALFVNGSFNTIKDITINGDDFGTGIELFHGSNNMVQQNHINACTVGIYIFRSNENLIESNTVMYCSKGVYLEEGMSNHISQNTVMNNEQGMFCSYASDNQIEQNNFINNVEHAKFAKFFHKGFLIPNKWNQNFWDDFKGFFVKPIFGLMFVPIGSPMGFFVPWIEFDVQPSNDPF